MLESRKKRAFAWSLANRQSQPLMGLAGGPKIQDYAPDARDTKLRAKAAY
jgi:hypothetical protein